jgi:plasmid stabilization system protein ParE
MTSLSISQQADQDLDRLTQFLQQSQPEYAYKAAQNIFHALSFLTISPEIGRPYSPPLRELVISQGKSGYLALYMYDPVADDVLVLRIRHQREVGYKNPS